MTVRTVNLSTNLEAKLSPINLARYTVDLVLRYYEARSSTIEDWSVNGTKNLTGGRQRRVLRCLEEHVDSIIGIFRPLNQLQ